MRPRRARTTSTGERRLSRNARERAVSERGSPSPASSDTRLSSFSRGPASTGPEQAVPGVGGYRSGRLYTAGLRLLGLGIRHGVGEALPLGLDAEQEDREPSYHEGGGPQGERVHEGESDQDPPEGRGEDACHPRHAARPSHAGGPDLGRVELGGPRVERTPGAQGEEAHQDRGGEQPSEAAYDGEEERGYAARQEVEGQGVPPAPALYQVRGGEEAG